MSNSKFGGLDAYTKREAPIATAGNSMNPILERPAVASTFKSAGSAMSAVLANIPKPTE